MGKLTKGGVYKKRIAELAKYKVLPEDEFYTEIADDSDDEEFNFDDNSDNNNNKSSEEEVEEDDDDEVDSDFDNPENETAEQHENEVVIDTQPLDPSAKKKKVMKSAYVDPAKKKNRRKSTRKLTVQKTEEYQKLIQEKESKVLLSFLPLYYYLLFIITFL